MYLISQQYTSQEQTPIEYRNTHYQGVFQFAIKNGEETKEICTT